MFLSRKLHPSHTKLWFLKKDAFEQLLLPSKMSVLHWRGAKKLNWPEICCKALSKLFLVSFQEAASGFKMTQDEAKMAKMRAKNAWMRPMIAKMKLKMAMIGPGTS